MFRLFPFRTRNWSSFNLRALLLGVTLAAIACGAVVHYYLPFQRQHVAIAALDGKYNSIDRRTGGPTWLRWFGEEHFQDVVVLHLENTDITDDDLKYVAQLPHLEKLYLAKTSITDEGLKHLRGLPKLQRMSLYTTRITGKGFEHLATCPELAEIDAHDVPVTDEGLAALAKMPKLKWYVAPDTIQEATLLKLAAFPKAESICYRNYLVFEHLTDASLPALLRPNVRAWRVRFVACQFSEESWRKLAASGRFFVLECGNTPIPEAIVLELFQDFPRNAESIHLDSHSLPFPALMRVLEQHSFARAEINLREMFYFSKHDQHMSCFSYRLGEDLSNSERVELFNRVQLEALQVGEQLAKSLWYEVESPGSLEFMPSLARQENLRSLTIQGTSDANTIRGACTAKDLRSLHFARVANSVTAEDLQIIGKLSELTDLHLPRGKFPGTHFDFLTKLPHLNRLNLTGNQVDARVLEIVSELPELEVLYLDSPVGSGVNDETIQALRNCRRLRELHCRATHITEASLPLFKEIASLRHLDLEGTGISQKAQVELQLVLRSRFVQEDTKGFFGGQQRSLE